MAKKIIGGVGSLLGLKKKKKAAEPAPAQATAESKRWTPIIKQLGASPPSRTAPSSRGRGMKGLISPIATILSDKLG